MTTRRSCLTLAMLAAALSLLGADAPAPTLDELLNIAPTHKPVKPAGPPKQMDDTAAPSEADGMQNVIDQMLTASTRLGRDRDPGLATQRLQKTILDRIDQMIKAAQQSQSSGKPSGEPNPNPQDRGNQQNAKQGQQQGRPAGAKENTGQASTGAPTQGGEVREEIRQHRVEWGNLPPRLRDQLLEGAAERFSPVYRSLTEQYYQRLAEDQP